MMVVTVTAVIAIVVTVVTVIVMTMVVNGNTGYRDEDGGDDDVVPCEPVSYSTHRRERQGIKRKTTREKLAMERKTLSVRDSSAAVLGHIFFQALRTFFLCATIPHSSANNVAVCLSISPSLF